MEENDSQKIILGTNNVNITKIITNAYYSTDGTYQKNSKKESAKEGQSGEGDYSLPIFTFKSIRLHPGLDSV